MFDADDLHAWQATLQVDFRAVMVGTHLAARAMMRTGTSGAIISVSSAAGVFALPDAPAYSAAKGGVVHFTRSAAKALAKRGLRIATVCPQFVATAFVPQTMRRYVRDKFGEMLDPSVVAQAVMDIARDPTQNGTVRVILQNGRAFDWQPQFSAEAEAALAHKPSEHSHSAPRFISAQPPHQERPLPAAFRQWAVKRLSKDFGKAVELDSVPMPDSVPAGHVLVRRIVSGVNASDVNFTSGAYHGSASAAKAALPFVAGFESVGVVMRAGPGCGAQRTVLAHVRSHAILVCIVFAARRPGYTPTACLCVRVHSICSCLQHCCHCNVMSLGASNAHAPCAMQSYVPAKRWRRSRMAASRSTQ